MVKSIYIETTIPSYIAARNSNDVTKLLRQIQARNFWDNWRNQYDCYVSDFVIAECEKGDERAALKRKEIINGLARLGTTSEVVLLAQIYKELLNIPVKKIVDAFHLAIAVVYQMDYVLTYNFSHMGHASYNILKEYNDAHGYKTPFLTTPDVLMGLFEEEEE